MSGFFFFFVFFLVSFSLEKKLFLFSSLSSSFLSSSFSVLSFLGVRKRREKIYLSIEARVFVPREREEYSHHHLRSRGTEGKETLAVITSSFSLFVVVVLFVSRRGTKCVISL